MKSLKDNSTINPTYLSLGPNTSAIPGFDKFYSFSDAMSPLGNATGEELSDFICMMFSDYTRKVTM